MNRVKGIQSRYGLQVVSLIEYIKSLKRIENRKILWVVNVLELRRE